MKRLKKRFNREKIYNYFGLDKRRNRIFFVFGVFFGYFFVFYFLPLFVNALYIFYGQKFGIVYFTSKDYFTPLFSSFIELFSMLITQPLNLLKEFSGIYFSVWAKILFLTENISDFYNDIDFYYFTLISVLIIVPLIIIRRILPKFKIIYLVLLGGGVIILSYIYIDIYINNIVFQNLQLF